VICCWRPLLPFFEESQVDVTFEYLVFNVFFEGEWILMRSSPPNPEYLFSITSHLMIHVPLIRRSCCVRLNCRNFFMRVSQTLLICTPSSSVSIFVRGLMSPHYYDDCSFTAHDSSSVDLALPIMDRRCPSSFCNPSPLLLIPIAFSSFLARSFWGFSN
jgi:hypothetical protein